VTKELEPKETSTAPATQVRERKPYRAPRIEESGQFEHLVLTCGHVMGGPQMGCMVTPNS
jgi:hypothetical protein